MKMDFGKNSFDAAALIYAHFPPPLISPYHQKIAGLVKPHGLVFLEGFSVNNLPLRLKDPRVGGPDNPDMLFSTSSIESDFESFEILQLEEAEIQLNEGQFHNGKAKVIRFVGRKH